MLIEQFGYRVLEIESLAELNSTDWQKADLVSVEGHHPGGIYHSHYFQFQQRVETDFEPIQIFRSANDRRKIRKSCSFFAENDYIFKISKMTEKDYQQFKKIYQASLPQKQRAVHYSIEDRVLGRILAGMPVYLLGMYHQQGLESCLVFFFDTNQSAVVAFGVKKRFHQARISVGGVLHYKLYQFCQKRGALEINLGKSLSPAGLITTAGLFEFKSRCGTTAYPEGSWKTTYILNPDVFLSDAIFVSVIDDQLGYVVATKEPNQETERKYVTNNITQIKLLDLNKLAKNSQQFLNSYAKSINN